MFCTFTFPSIERAEAIPAACPIAIQQGSMRRVENPMCEPDTGTQQEVAHFFRDHHAIGDCVYCRRIAQEAVQMHSSFFSFRTACESNA